MFHLLYVDYAVKRLEQFGLFFESIIHSKAQKQVVSFLLYMCFGSVVHFPFF